ncbi:hypothetical protein C7M41_02024 (plasmid) [Pediococcus acidilactici]|nr:hypothetical protein C7M41_02024 [Pediococcus acidilactici]QHM55293.1 hypothetical protein C7M42_02057 [Pediococcus acidilactici]
MNELTTEIIAALAQKQDLDEAFRHHLEIAINQLLQTELADFWITNATHTLGLTLVITAQQDCGSGRRLSTGRITARERRS